MISNDTKDFNALAELNGVIAFEEKHESDYRKASEFPIELSSIHNYSLGTTYFYHQRRAVESLCALAIR